MAARQQVIIVGGGPVGVGLGLELGVREIDCAVIERRKELARIPKGQNLTPRTLEHFYFWGIVDEVRAARLMPKDYPGELTTCETLLSDYGWGPQRTQPGGGFIRPHYYEDNDRMPQYQLEAVMR